MGKKSICKVEQLSFRKQVLTSGGACQLILLSGVTYRPFKQLMAGWKPVPLFQKSWLQSRTLVS
jgi:hypothetical protein